MSIEIADAYVALTVQAPGIKRDIESELNKVDADGAGKKIGTNLGGGISAKGAAIAGAIGGLVASAANIAAGAISDLIGDAVTASDATEKFAQTLSFAGLDTTNIDAAMAAARAYADSTVYDLSTIQNTTAQLAANGIENYSELTEAAGNLNAVAGGNQNTFASVAMALTQTAGAGKLTTENWNQLANAIPGASGRLQEALLTAGAYTGNFREAMEKGEISADEFNAALLELGTEPVAQEAAASVSTMEGAVGNLSASIVGVLSDAFTVIKPALTGFTSLLADFIANSKIFVPVISGLAVALLVALAPAIWAAVTATWAFTVALLANPLTWIVIAIGLLIAGIVALAMNWDTVVKWITDVWGGFISWITGVIEGFVGWWNEVWGSIGQVIADIWQNWIVGPIENAINWIVAVVTTGLGLLKSGWESVWTGIGNFVKGLWNNILGWIEGGVNGAIDLINGFTSGIRDAGKAVFGVDIGPIPHVALPRLAQGAIVSGSSTGTLAMIGEAGHGRDEAVLPLPEGWRENGFGGGGEVTMYNTFQQTDPRMQGRALAREYTRAMAAS